MEVEGVMLHVVLASETSRSAAGRCCTVMLSGRRTAAGTVALDAHPGREIAHG